MISDYVYVMAHKDGSAPLFIKIHPDKVVEVIDKLSDNKYTAGECATWFWNAQLDEYHSEKLPDSVCYEIDLCHDVDEVLNDI